MKELAEIAGLVRAYPLTTLAAPAASARRVWRYESVKRSSKSTATACGSLNLPLPANQLRPFKPLRRHSAYADIKIIRCSTVVLQYLRSRSLLLIVDNCEHVVEETARVVDAILRGAPNIRILATSREPLSIAAEHVYRVPSLAVPRGATTSVAVGAALDLVALFAERAGAADAAFRLTDDNAPVVGEICNRLDGIPLAIELAAARTTVLSVTEIVEKLDQRFSVLTPSRRTSIPRQQTLRALIDWSYDLLPERDKNVFRSLGVFPGSFLLDAVAGTHEGISEESFGASHRWSRNHSCMRTRWRGKAATVYSNRSARIRTINYKSPTANSMQHSWHMQEPTRRWPST